jgi:hypothetical protein
MFSKELKRVSFYFIVNNNDQIKKQIKTPPFKLF